MKTVLYLLLSILLFHTAILAQNNPNNQINVYFLSGVSRSGINNSSATISDESISNFLSGYNIPATNVIPTFPAFNESDTFNVESGESSKQMNRAKIFTITLTDPTLKPTILNVLSNFSSVLYAESNGMTSTNVMPNDINYNQQWGLKNNNTTNADIHAEGAWDIFTGNPNSIIAIIVFPVFPNAMIACT